MATEQDIPQPAAMSRSDDLVSKLYREIGISALAATAHKPQKSMRTRRDKITTTSNLSAAQG